jgi:hypothetical protein
LTLYPGSTHRDYGSIPDDDRKYDVHLWKVHMMIMGSTHTIDGKYCKVPAKDCKNVKKNHKNNEVQQLILGSTHDDDEKYKYSVFRSA